MNTDKKTHYNPTASDRCKVACEFDNINRSHFDPEFKPSDYFAEGACVTLGDPNTESHGATYWVVTIPEAKDLGITYDQCDTLRLLGRKWVVVLN